MNKTKKFTNLLLLALLLLNYSCGVDEVIETISLQDLEVTIDENPTVGQIIGTIQSNSSGSLTYSITSQTPTGALSIDSNTGELTVANATLFDFETNPIITAVVSSVGAQNTATVTINLNDLNEIGVQDLSITIDENPINGQVVGTIVVNGNGTTSFSITSQTPAGALNIDANTGELTVADATLFDFETNPTITAVVSSVGALNTGTVTINLNDLNEISVQDLNIIIDENPTAGQAIGTMQTTGSGTVNFSITSETPAGALSINSTTGVLTVADVALFDFETNPIITAVITSEGALNTGVVTVNLNNINEIGDFIQGGIVFWVDPADNAHGLVVSTSDQSSSAEWGCEGLDIPGAYSVEFGDGATNTLTIVSSCAVPGIAADIANDWNEGYNDWFMPTPGEWLELYTNRAIINAAILANGGSIITEDRYWTSTTYHSWGAYTFNINDGTYWTTIKTDLFKVRSIRAF